MRFRWVAYKNTFHSPVTPVLTLSSSTQSSPRPITPPHTSHVLPGPSPSFRERTSSRKSRAVRFKYKMNEYRSPPATPALTSASSIPSSSGPITPPQTSHGIPEPSPYSNSSYPNFSTKPPLYVVPPRAHPLLESAALMWDFIEPQHYCCAQL